MAPMDWLTYVWNGNIYIHVDADLICSNILVFIISLKMKQHDKVKTTKTLLFS